MDFTFRNDHTVKIKENEKRDKYLDLAWEQKKAVEYKGNGHNKRN